MAKVISRGGFGRVEEIELADGSRVARKVFDPSFEIASVAERAKLLKRFRREARIQASLNCVGIVSILQLGLDEDPPWYQMPLADRNFAVEIAETRRAGQSPEQGLADVLNALDELHELGYVHRDLKPANVLFLDGVWRLADFGLVRPPPGSTAKLTSDGSNWGTEAYCAPEQSVEFRSVTHLSDIYSFGCILHDIYGVQPRVPYQRHSAPGEVGVIIERCTETRPARRFQSITALRRALLPRLTAFPTASAQPGHKEWDVWTAKVLKVASWDRETIDEFVRFVGGVTPRYRDLFLLHLDEVVFAHVAEVDADLLKSFAVAYCEWVGQSYLDTRFALSDVLVGRLEALFNLGDVEVKALAALAAARLGRTTNRFFVMGRVMHMCGASLDEVVARRMAIEINADEAQEDFRCCASAIGRDLTDYHTHIAALLM